MKSYTNKTARPTPENELGVPITLSDRENTESWGFVLKDKKRFPLNKSKGSILNYLDSICFFLEWQKPEIKIDDYVLPLVRRFVFRLKRVFLHKNLKLVSDEMLRMINDRSFFRNKAENGYKVSLNS